MPTSSTFARARYDLLLCVRAGLPSAVTDLAVASGFNDATVSQALRLLRAAGAVAAARDGRTMRYTVAGSAFVRSLQAEPDEAATACASGPRQLHRPDTSQRHRPELATRCVLSDLSAGFSVPPHVVRAGRTALPTNTMPPT